jgi:hypothetical protein
MKQTLNSLVSKVPLDPNPNTIKTTQSSTSKDLYSQSEENEETEADESKQTHAKGADLHRAHLIHTL